MNRRMLLLAPWALVLGSCGRDAPVPTAARVPINQTGAELSARGRGEFYPLAIGNKWHYVRTAFTQFVPSDGSPPQPPTVVRAVLEREQVCGERVSGVDYVEERLTDTRDVHVTRTWASTRQDRDGLYVRFSATPPACEAPDTIAGTVSDARGVSGGEPEPAREDEIVLLRYPLHVGARWQEVTGQPVFRRVVGVTTIALPTGRRVLAYRVQTYGAGIASNVTDEQYYSTSGYLGSRWRHTSPGPNGGTYVSWGSITVDAISIRGE